MKPVEVIPCNPAVNESEQVAIERLKSGLISEASNDDQWILLTNLDFSAANNRQSDEIDIVVIGPPGVQIVEVKHWNSSWCKRNKEHVEHEANLTNKKTRKVATTLRKQFHDLPYVNGVFLVTEEAKKVEALEGKEIHGVSFTTLKNWKKAVGFHSAPVLSPQKVKGLADALQPGSKAIIDGHLRHIGDYINLNLQTNPEQRFHRIYKAIHKDRKDKVILHIYDLSVRDEPNAEQQAERAWKSLVRLSKYSWTPQILDSFQDVLGYPGEMKFFTIIDPQAPSIKERSEDSSWDTTDRLAFSQKAIEALIELHSAGENGEHMIHRNLNPGKILVKNDAPILIGFEHTRIPNDVTVASPAPVEDDEFTSPEVCRSGRAEADQQSDIFSLCASLEVLFKRREDELSCKVMEILAFGTCENPEERATLLDLEEKLSTLRSEARQKELPSTPPARFWAEDQIISCSEENYRIISRLGSGGVGTTFKVVHMDRTNESEFGTYVAKVVHKEEAGQKVLNAYNLARAHLGHSELATIFEVASEWKNNSFVALMKWIDGESLREYLGMFDNRPLDHRANEEKDLTLVHEWLRTMCKALNLLHNNGLVHGDVSPGNMIVSSGSSIVLTDYDCVAKIGESRKDVPGTPLYCSPPLGEGAAPSDDIYALAASFFHILFNKEPFQHNGALAKERGLNWNGIERESYGQLADFLDQATDPDRSKRFISTTKALEALRLWIVGNTTPAEAIAVAADGQVGSVPFSLIKEEGEPGERRNNEVEWLQYLLQSYPGSRWGNSETRGLDTDFAKETYVETRLEKELYAAITKRRVKLIILCGNAGDGKTALLQHLAQKLGLKSQSSATRILKGKLSNGLVIHMNLDGSASWNNHSADDLLNNFLELFQDGCPKQDVVHLLAINDGRLLEWIETVEEDQDETYLTRSLRKFLEKGSASQESHIRFVNLNQRSLVGGISEDKQTIDTSFLDDLVDSLYGGKKSLEIWRPCRMCSAQDRCETFRAAQYFGPDSLAETDTIRKHARERLFEALQAVHLRGETHITVRELRGTLVYILFGTHYCSDYHISHNSPDIPDPQPFWERAFSPESAGRQGELLAELPYFDPALEAQPQIDHHLLSQRPDLNNVKNLKYLRRRAYFELPKEQIERLTGDPNALGLARGNHLSRFRGLAMDPQDGEDNVKNLTQRICGGISRLQVLPPQALQRSKDGKVPLPITPKTPTETAFWIEKSIDDFGLEPDIKHGDQGLDRLHRQVILTYHYHDGATETLRLGADLFHLLLELSDGYQLSDAAMDDTFAHLSIFVQRLVQEDHRRLLAWNPMEEGTIFEVMAHIDDTGPSPQQQMVVKPLAEPRRQDSHSGGEGML